MAQLTPSDAAIGFPNRSEDQLQPKKTGKHSGRYLVDGNLPINIRSIAS